MPSWLPENTTPVPFDLEIRSLWKLVDLAGGGSSTGGGTLYGVGSPEGAVTADQGDLYSNSTQELWQKFSGNGTNTGWVQML